MIGSYRVDCPARMSALDFENDFRNVLLNDSF